MNAKRLLSLAPLQIAQALIGFGAIAAFTRLMSAEDFGKYALALSISMAAHTMVFTWAEAAAFRFFTAARAEGRLADHFATLRTLGVTLGLGALTLTAITLSVSDLNRQVVALTLFAVGSAVLRFVTRIGRETDRAALSFTRYTVFETGYLVVGFIIGVALLTITELGAAAPFAGLLAAGVLVVLMDAPRMLRNAQGGTASLSRSISYASYGAPLALALAADLGVQAIARVVLAGEAGAASLGAYAAAFGLARALDVVFMGVSAAFAPLVFAAYEDSGPAAAREAARKGFVLLTLVTTPACLGLALLAQPVAAVMVGSALRVETAAALPWMALSALFYGFSLYYWSEAFQLTRRTGQRALLMLIPGAVQLGLTIALSAKHGAMGAAIAAAAGAIISALVLASAGRRLLALPMPWAELFRICGAAAIMAGAIFLLPNAAAPHSLMQSIAAGAVVYAAAAVALNVMGSRTLALAALQSWLRRLQPPETADAD